MRHCPQYQPNSLTQDQLDAFAPTIIRSWEHINSGTQAAGSDAHSTVKLAPSQSERRNFKRWKQVYVPGSAPDRIVGWA
jgi:hypothetical protein